VDVASLGRARTWGTGLLALMPLALGACWGAGASGVTCPDRFDSQAWRTAAFDSRERKTLADQVVKCGYLRGADKQRVRLLLGRAERLEGQYRSEYKREWYYLVGETNSTLGPADEQSLAVTFDRHGRVKRVEVSPP
jgi:hypothetical protein